MSKLTFHLLFRNIIVMIYFYLCTVSSPRTTVKLSFIVPLSCGLKMRMGYLLFSIFRRFFQVFVSVVEFFLLSSLSLNIRLGRNASLFCGCACGLCLRSADTELSRTCVEHSRCLFYIFRIRVPFGYLSPSLRHTSIT